MSFCLNGKMSCELRPADPVGTAASVPCLLLKAVGCSGMLDERMGILKPCLPFASVNPSVKGITNIVLPASSSLPGGLVPPIRAGSQHHLRAGPPLQPETSNYLWGGCRTGERFRLAQMAVAGSTLP